MCIANLWQMPDSTKTFIYLYTHTFLVWYFQQYKVSVLQCVRYSDHTLLCQVPNIKPVYFPVS